MTNLKYYVSKAQDFYKGVSAPNADPTELAEWAATTEPNKLAIVTAKGELVGTGHYVDDRGLKLPTLDTETVKKYGFNRYNFDWGMQDISKKIGEPVVFAKEAYFHGPVSHKAD